MTSGAMHSGFFTDGSWRAWVPTEPVAQPRHRHGKFGAYLPKGHPVKLYKGMLHAATIGIAPEQRYRGPVAVGCYYFVTARKADVQGWKVSKPDLDNYLKSTFDALNGRLWEDDAQVAALCAWKGAAQSEPGVLLVVQKLERPCPGTYPEVLLRDTIQVMTGAPGG